MNEQGLKALENLGAELGAAKAENEKLRGLLNEVQKLTKSQRMDSLVWSMHVGRINAALSRQAEPTDTFTAVDMATAAAQGFRDGQAAQVSYPDFRPQLSALVKACQRYIDSDGAECFPDDALIEATVALERDAHAASVRYATRRAQTAPQPEQSGLPDPRQWTDQQVLDFLGVALRNVDVVGTVQLNEIRQGFELVIGRAALSAQGAGDADS